MPDRLASSSPPTWSTARRRRAAGSASRGGGPGSAARAAGGGGPGRDRRRARRGGGGGHPRAVLGAGGHAQGAGMNAVAALIRKDLRMELRTRESVPSMFLFSLSTFVLLRFGLARETLSGDLASGVLWVTLLFAAVLGMNRLFVAEREEGGFDAFLLAPVDRTSLFVAKAAVLFG